MISAIAMLSALLVSTGVVTLAEIGDKLATRLPLQPIRIAAAAVFAVLGTIALSGYGV